MENNKQSLIELYQDFLDNKVSSEQIRELKNLFGSDDELTLRLLISEALKHQEGEVRNDEDERLKKIFSNVNAEIGKERKSSSGSLYVRIMAAAAAVIVISLIGIGYFNGKKTGPQQQTSIATIDVAPGTNKAILTLSDGKKISLTDAQNGELASQTGVSITKMNDGQIVYSAQNNVAVNTCNTVETPKGGEYRVTLPDGTKVWLNAASSLKYPTSFSALKERRIELSGEAYFEVAHNKAQPFRVVTNGQTVEVLGTHFNVNSYADEKKITTTLEEGSVKVYSNSQTKIIKPGQQTILSAGTIEVQQADLQTALAWKNGLIKFKGANLQAIMHQVSRWYNINVEYKGNMPKDLFTGGVSRTANLSELLKILELSGVHFTLTEQADGKKLIVEP